MLYITQDWNTASASLKFVCISISCKQGPSYVVSLHVAQINILVKNKVTFSFFMLSMFLLTVFVAHGHNPVHVVGIVHDVTREIFDIHANIWSFFYLWGKNVTLSPAVSIKQLIQANLFSHLLQVFLLGKMTVVPFMTGPPRQFWYESLNSMF